MVADINGDLFPDILATASSADNVVWFRNLGGKGNFGQRQFISQSTDGASAVFTVDLDGDNDLDVLTASRGDDKIAWFENVNGLGTFSSENIISTEADGAWDVFASDIDGDGDMDVLSASNGDGSWPGTKI